MANLTDDQYQRLTQAFPDSEFADRVKDLINHEQGPQDVSYSIDAESANTSTVSCRFKDSRGNDMSEACVVRQYLAEAADGQVVEAAATSLAVGTDGTILVEETANAIWTAVSEADGDLDIV